MTASSLTVIRREVQLSSVAVRLKQYHFSFEKEIRR
jgi:hypothetical protein